MDLKIHPVTVTPKIRPHGKVENVRDPSDQPRVACHGLIPIRLPWVEEQQGHAGFALQVKAQIRFFNCVVFNSVHDLLYKIHIKVDTKILLCCCLARKCGFILIFVNKIMFLYFILPPF